MKSLFKIFYLVKFFQLNQFKSLSLISIFIFASFTFLPKANAYPEFIGMGYTSCITCHFNGAGNGALNDYGRGLFAAGIASKIFWNSKQSDDSLSSKSGFLGSKALPFWFRPSIKYRGLSVEKSPGSKEENSKSFYQMQKDFNLHLPFNEEQTFLIALNFGTVESESAASPNQPLSGSLVVTREHYLRGQLSETLWFYLGFMDKVFGIRHPNHTAVNRSFLGLGQNSQVHGLVLHFSNGINEFFFNPFFGNLLLSSKLQMPGFTVHYEHEPIEKLRLGFSFMRDRDIIAVERNTFSFLVKRGIEGGHSILFETGIKNSLLANLKTTNNVYAWTQATMKLLRGIFFNTNMEYFKSDITKLATETLGLGLGVTFFPLQRVEIRFSGVSSRTINPNIIDKDSWALLSQVHLSF